ncbi:hypothetical protein A3J17_00715 [Candidatus Curtissbacteria bacterium RIFCSPLOWO2_02_FULL_40_11]|uniref:Methyltransferase domain-containing protein n=2 Tax=Candidatus Curtissiibacteriota TaxID=1752717 RepID=A0A1F5G9N0_9BACT|nr:MAG: hypothetical protein A3D04_05175 [Candidatus Curtissbacteria bacterium RIFCSPHIGHO2_02_FULL_40_16b]OGD99309.1 MAG: hypothetical protein A3J17_00715 [Candidatus Curtissbacteria bacterium RIFCSPLOWO2_02_FULL_40_11]OGE12975.1 MAG: hypothetical protein A3G14_03495 [Candidatus Curtissbacteria bacterium RIFCSPLOWO2_12_FULL_38_9]
MRNPDLQEIEKFTESAENSRIRAELWGDFVGWSGRRRGENGFLITQLKYHTARRVLDVALGDGADAIFLLQKGFDVATNELDNAFRKKAIENAKKAGLGLNPTSLDWRNLSSEYEPNSFDALICMGNSLTCIKSREGQVDALRQFREILSLGGVLLIDERNYQRMLDNREATIAGTLKSNANQVYTGTNRVKTRFLELNNEMILAQYTHLESGMKAYYNAYPFKKGELLGLLKEAGFSRIEKFSDYEPGDNPDADFYQYVCVK